VRSDKRLAAEVDLMTQPWPQAWRTQFNRSTTSATVLRKMSRSSSSSKIPSRRSPREVTW